jgi:Tfp pilus assembly protein PilF
MIPGAPAPPAGARSRGAEPDRAALPYTPERIGLLTLMACVIVFGVHSGIDWTWFVPGNACVALLCAGWVAGRGPLDTSPGLAAARLPGSGSGPAASLQGRRRWAPVAAFAAGWRPALSRLAAGARLRLRPLDRGRAATAVVVLAVTGAVTWSQWQPLRSANAADDALAALSVHDFARARALALTADRRDPVSVDPLFDLAVIETAAGNRAAAHRALDRAVRRQPANPGTWLRLAEFDLTELDNPTAALKNLRPALFLDPRSFVIQADVLTVLRRMATGPARPRPAAPTTATAPGALIHPGPGRTGTSSATTP